MLSNGQATKEIMPGENEVIARLEKCDNIQTLRELDDFGKQMVRDSMDRVNWLDTKSGVFLGFTGALIVVIVSTFSSWKDLTKDLPSAPIFLFFGLASFLLAAFSAVMGLRVRKFQGLDEKDLWFAQEYFQFPDQLRRYYLVGMYRTVVSHNRLNGQKADKLQYTERFVVAGISLLAVPILMETWQLGIGHELTALLDLLNRWGF